MKSTELTPVQAAITIAFVVIGVVLILVRAWIEHKRGKHGRVPWLIFGSVFGPLFAVAAFWSTTVPRGLFKMDTLVAAVGAWIAIAIPVALLVRRALRPRPREAAGPQEFERDETGELRAKTVERRPPARHPVRAAVLVALLVVLAGAAAFVRLRWARVAVPHMDTIASTIALVFATAFVIAFLSAILPWFLDRLEGRTFVSFVATRHVRSQKSGFLTVVSVLSICAVAISSCALSSTVSIMGGFSSDLKRKILGNNAHIVIDTVSQAPFSDYDSVLARVRSAKGVAAATPVVNGEVMVSSAANIAGVVVRGIDTKTIGSVIDLPNNLEVGKMAYLEDPEKLRHLPADEVIGIGPGGEKYLKGADTLSFPDIPDDLDDATKRAIIAAPLRPGLIVGRELAKTLHVYVGDEVTLVSPLGDLGPMGVMPRTRKFRVAAIFFSGMYEYDASHVYTTLGEAQDYFELPGKISAIDVRVEDAENAELTTPAVTAAVNRPDLRVRDWREMYKNLFSALKLERFATFIILSIAIIVGSFCIVSTLLLMITEKAKEIAILKAIGARDHSVLRTFMLEGIIIGGIGTIYGVITAFVLCTELNWFGLRLDPDVYYIDRLPINVSGSDFLLVTIAASAICTLATIFPARAASQLRPVDGLRYE